MSNTGRRHFLKVIASAGASVIAAPACMAQNGTGPENVGDISAGNASALAVGTLKAIGSQPACIGRDENGIYAMTLTCTHQACNMASQGSVSAAGISCACHGSRFDTSGNVTRGPASTSLAHLEVTADSSGNLTVHTGSTVSASVRLDL
jgi:Rieske Fe-S protein